MIPAAFDYLSPETIEEAVRLLEQHGDDAKILAGGHSLIPAMKLRLAQPKTVIDLGRVGDLKHIREDAESIVIGAMVTHYEIESSEIIRRKCPLLAELAPQIGDVQVRHRGTIGGSLAHADPAADWPAAILALEAELEIAGANGRRRVPAAKFFLGLMQTAAQATEILCQIRVRLTPPSVAYVKFTQQASGFAIAGVAAVVEPAQKRVRVGVTGVSATPYRAKAVEAYLRGKDLNAALIARGAGRAVHEIECLNDIHASAEFRAHLARVHTRRALELASSRA